MTTETKETSMLDTAARAALQGHYEDAFPILTEAEIARLRHLGKLRWYRDGEALYEAGQPSPGMAVVS